MLPETSLVEKFRTDLDPLITPGSRIGIAVSGGADSLALLLLAAAARRDDVEAATVDHALRPAAADEAAMVAEVCAKLGVRHSILTVRWNETPESAIQERARRERYRLLGYWAEERGMDTLLTGHHAGDQAETLMMRLARGSGVKGLAGMRRRSVAPGTRVRLVRPLLGWNGQELEQVCAAAGITPVADPSNRDERFERVRVRRALASLDWLDPAAVARSAAHLADADAALDWAAANEWRQAVRERGGTITYRPGHAPTEIVRRIVARAIRALATEGDPDLRGAELDRLVSAVAAGDQSTARGVLCTGGAEWRFTAAPPRR